ncbi:hypothetical protein FB446DRAFT_795753 [Lentinula raphanica]|nr:hypothetical protein FB446DRAFT_795753 [Lentinula raphanica]
MVSASTALVHRNQQDPLIVLEDAFTDPVLRVFVHSYLGERFRSGSITDKDIIQLSDRQYAFAPDYAKTLWSKLAKIATIVVAAAKGVHKDIENGIPRDVLSFEWLRRVIPHVFDSIAFPHLSLAHDKVSNILLNFRSTSSDGIKELVEIFHSLVLFYCRWVRDMVKLSIAKGLASEVNWG